MLPQMMQGPGQACHAAPRTMGLVQGEALLAAAQTVHIHSQ
jgi:hypothetical protein